MAKTKTQIIDGLDAFTRAYIDCALWSSSDDGGAPLDGEYTRDSLTLDALALIVRECKDFISYASDLLNESSLSDEQAGHDFWLTRNGHGAGFWDRGLGELGDKLSAAAKTFGSCDLTAYHGRIYVD